MKPIPTLSHWLTAVVDVGARRSLGAWQGGERFVVDILGGQAQGPGLSARVLPGGADRQWLRPDGVKELDAIYELELDDGTVISVHNQALVDESVPARRYACSHVRLRVAEAGPWAWLNRRVLVGDVHTMRPQRDAVEVRFFVVQTGHLPTP